MKEFPPFRLDEQNKLLLRSGRKGADERIELTPKAFDVLSLLVSRPGKLVSHDDFLESLWPNLHVQPEVLKGHILAVRTALGDNSKKPRFIETVRQRGYRFIAAVSEGTTVDETTFADRNVSKLVGRDEELSQLAAYLSETFDGRSGLVFVSGDAGMGKTRLVDEFVQRMAAKQNGITVVRTQCVETFGEIEPWYPVLEALSRISNGPSRADLLEALEAVAPTWLVQLPVLTKAAHRDILRQEILGATRGRMLREICELLERLATTTPIVLIFEDVHWSDASTIDLISTFSRRRSRARLMLIATYRPADAEVAGHPIHQVLLSLKVSSICHDIELRPLGLGEVEKHLFPTGKVSPADADLARLIFQQSGGNPLFMAAMIDELVDRTLIKRTSQGWRANSSLERPTLIMPKSLAQVIEARVGRLTMDQQRILEAASLTQPSFCSAINASALAMNRDSFEDVCEVLLRKHRLIRKSEIRRFADGDTSQSYEFTHAAYRHVCFARQVPIRRTQALGAVATQIEKLYAESIDDVSSELAFLYAGARNWTAAQRHLRAALQIAKRRHAHREALAILDQAVNFAENLPDREREHAKLECLEYRAEIFAAAHDEQTAEAYSELASRASGLRLIDVEARACIGLAYAQSWQSAKKSLASLEKALQISARQRDPQLRARTRISSYVWRIWIGGWNETDARNCELSLQDIQKGNDDLTRSWAMIEYSMILMVSARYREGNETIRRNFQALIERSEARPDLNVSRAIWMARLGIPWSLMYLGELGAALEEFDSGIRQYLKNGNEYGARTLKAYRAWLLLHCMDFTGVLEECDAIAMFAPPAIESGLDFEKRLLPAESRLISALRGLALIGLGRYQDAASHLRDAQREMERHPVIFDWYWRLSVEWGVVEVLLGTGDLVAALAGAEKLVETAKATAERTHQTLAWDLLARVALRRGDHDTARHAVEKALELADAGGVPLAEWRTHMTATAVFGSLGEDRPAIRHNELAAQLVTKLADSLPPNHQLRNRFTSIALHRRSFVASDGASRQKTKEA